MSGFTKTFVKSQISLKAQIFSALIASLCAVLLPQIVHSVGALLGIGSIAGEILLPMHFPVLLVGLLAGPVAGIGAGALSPMLSVLLTGMPSLALLPFMCVELSIYGFISGSMKNKRVPTTVKVLLAQIGGRAVRAAVILVAQGFGFSSLPCSIIWTSVVVGFPGIMLQLLFIPLIIRMVSSVDGNE